MSEILGWGFTAFFVLAYVTHLFRLWKLRNIEEETEIDNVSLPQCIYLFIGFVMLGAYGVVIEIELVIINGVLGGYYTVGVVAMHLMFRDETRAELRGILREAIKKAKKDLK